jgi:hypothetical protein
MTRFRVLPLMIAATLLAAGCNRDEATPAADPAATAAAPAADAPAAAPAATPPPPEEMMPLELPEPVIDTTPVDTTISAIDASNAATDVELTGPLSDEFTGKDSIFLAIRTNGTAEKYTISSKWFYPDGEVITENSQIVTGAGPASTIFSMSKPDGWAPGTYKVEFSINGKLQQTKTFVVR